MPLLYRNVMSHLFGMSFTPMAPVSAVRAAGLTHAAVRSPSLCELTCLICLLPSWSSCTGGQHLGVGDKMQHCLAGSLAWRALVSV